MYIRLNCFRGLIMAQQQTIGRTATTITTENGTTKIRYHSTVIVEFNHEKIILNSGGWYTATTKTRMNQTSSQFDLGFSISQKDYEWRVYVHRLDVTLPFYDNMIILR